MRLLAIAAALGSMVGAAAALLRAPITGIADCCARVASGQAAAARPKFAADATQLSTGCQPERLAKPARRRSP